MAADVSSLLRVMNGGDTNHESAASGKSTAPITRDLLGGCCTLDSKELDLDLQVPCGWEKRLDLKVRLLAQLPRVLHPTGEYTPIKHDGAVIMVIRHTHTTTTQYFYIFRLTFSRRGSVICLASLHLISYGQKMSGKVYLQRCNSSNSSSSTSENKQRNTKSTSKFQDLNFPPSLTSSLSSRQTLILFDEPSLDLKLVSPLSVSPSSSNYQSVCTLDKVKSALERAEREETVRKRSVSSMSKSSSPRSTSSSSVKDGDLDHDEKSTTASIAAGCPRCLLYVLISSGDPKCPRCNSNVPLPGVVVKKPRIDLNISI
ncbi:hypothetical protein OROGR_012518 [Orobanche gracilis]